jgi:hypothetical protein
MKSTDLTRKLILRSEAENYLHVPGIHLCVLALHKCLCVVSSGRDSFC